MNSKKGLSRIMSALLAASSMIGGASASRVKNPAVNEASNSMRKKGGKKKIKNKVSVQSSAGGLSDFFKNPRNCIDTALSVVGGGGIIGTAYFWNRQRKLDAALSEAKKFLSELGEKSAIVAENALSRFYVWFFSVMCSSDSFLGVEIGKDNKAVVNIVNCFPSSNSSIGLVETGDLNKRGVANSYITDYTGAMFRLGCNNLVHNDGVRGGFNVILGDGKTSCRISVKRTDNGEFEKFDDVSGINVEPAVNRLVGEVKKYFSVGVSIDDFTLNNLPDIEMYSLNLIEKVIEAAYECIVAKEVKESVKADVISEESGDAIISKLKNFKFIDFSFFKECGAFGGMGVQICDAKDEKNKKVVLKKMRTWRQEYNNKLDSE